MGLQPLDLQTLFLHMNQPAKDQAVSREAVVQSQVNQAGKLVEQSLQAQNDVTPATAENERELRVEEREGRPSPEKREKRAAQPQEGEAQEGSPNVFQDDRVGRKIDLTG